MICPPEGAGTGSVGVSGFCVSSDGFSVLFSFYSSLTGGVTMNPGSGSVQLVSPIMRSKKNRNVFANFIFVNVNLFILRLFVCISRYHKSTIYLP